MNSACLAHTSHAAAFCRLTLGTVQAKVSPWKLNVPNGFLVVLNHVANVRGGLSLLAGSSTHMYRGGFDALLTSCPPSIWNWPAVVYESRIAVPGTLAGFVWRYLW